MAQDTAAADVNPQDIDIDDLEVEIFILAKNPDKLKSTCSFLARRGWPTQAVSNLSSAVEYIAEKRPDFVLISLNHPSPAILKLPEIISQTFNLTVIGFVEQTDAGSSQRLNRFKMRYKIFGQPSGPNFQRTIRRILAEKFNIKIDDKGGPEESSDRGAKAINVRGSRPPGERGKSSRVVDAGDPDSRDSISAEMAIENMNDAPEHFGDVQVAKGGKIGYMPTHSSGETQGSNGVMLQKGAVSSSRGQVAALGAKSKGEDDDGDQNSEVISTGKYTLGKPKRKSLKELSGATRSRDAAGNLLFGENLDPNSPPVTPAASGDLLGMLKKSLFGESGQESATSGPQSIMEKAIENAIGGLCKNDPDQAPISLEIVKHLGVFPVDSQAQPGYLVLALDLLAEDVRKEFFAQCQSALTSAFGQLGVPGKIEPGFWVDVPEVSFDVWAEVASTFQVKLNHQSAELGIAFFQAEKSIPKGEPAAEKGMTKIALDNIDTNHPVNFKAYIHLKQNQKFYLYLRNGRQLQPEQKLRLKEANVHDIYMKNVDAENLRVFLASAFLINTIKKPQDDAA